MLVIVADKWNPQLGGRERYAQDLVTYLIAHNRQVVKAVTGRLDIPRASRVLALSPVHEATHYQLHGGLMADAFEAERTSMQSMLRRRLFYPALRLNRRRQRVLTEEENLLAGSAALMTFSESVKRELIRKRGVAPSRVLLARPGVDLERFKPPPNEPEAFNWKRPLRLAFVGHNFALKGLRAAILALARVRGGGIDASLTVVGRAATTWYRCLAVKLGVSRHVTFAGTLSQDALACMYRISDALVHPTFYDPFPRAVIEALASGCPVITTERCGAAEILTVGEEGLVIRNPDDVAALADAIGTLSHRATLIRMRVAAAALGRQFDASNHFRETSEWLFNGGDPVNLRNR